MLDKHANQPSKATIFVFIFCAKLNQYWLLASKADKSMRIFVRPRGVIKWSQEITTSTRAVLQKFVQDFKMMKIPNFMGGGFNVIVEQIEIYIGFYKFIKE